MGRGNGAFRVARRPFLELRRAEGHAERWLLPEGAAPSTCVARGRLSASWLV